MNEQQLRKYAELLLNGEWIRNYDADAVFLAVRFPPGTDLSSMGSREDAIAKLVHLSKNTLSTLQPDKVVNPAAEVVKVACPEAGHLHLVVRAGEPCLICGAALSKKSVGESDAPPVVGTHEELEPNGCKRQSPAGQGGEIDGGARSDELRAGRAECGARAAGGEADRREVAEGAGAIPARTELNGVVNESPFVYCGRCDKYTPTLPNRKCPICTKYKPLPDEESTPSQLPSEAK